MDRSAGSLVGRDDCVLAVVDVQERLLPHIHEGERVVEAVVKLARFAKIVGIPILWAEQEKLGPTPAPIRAELSDLEPFGKACFGCLGSDAFRERLEALGRRTVVVCGVEAHICVAQTALQALATHRVHVVADAVGSRTPENRAIALDRLRQAGATVTSTEMFFYEILRKAGTDEFRAVLPLVK
ncbi:MAG: hydrolase [Deferrisomatales bacterium]|nr:hydrolase [Deferrisomatales bacterium]